MIQACNCKVVADLIPKTFNTPLVRCLLSHILISELKKTITARETLRSNFYFVYLLVYFVIIILRIFQEKIFAINKQHVTYFQQAILSFYFIFEANIGNTWAIHLVR